jgi:hypothetical protein
LGFTPEIPMPHINTDKPNRTFEYEKHIKLTALLASVPKWMYFAYQMAVVTASFSSDIRHCTNAGRLSGDGGGGVCTAIDYMLL